MITNVKREIRIDSYGKRFQYWTVETWQTNLQGNFVFHMERLRKTRHGYNIYITQRYTTKTGVMIGFDYMPYV